MSDFFLAGQTWLAAQLLGGGSQAVVYLRAAQGTSVLAVLGSQLLKTSDRWGNVKVERTQRDFLIAAADLVAGGISTPPRQGDRVQVTTADGATETFEVAAVGTEPCYRWSDAYRQVLRIHTKAVGVGLA